MERPLRVSREQFKIIMSATAQHDPAAAEPGLNVGIDMVSIARIRESLAAFPDRFVRRIYSTREAEYAMSSPAHCASRLAARFAAKEAAIKALRLAESAVCWRDIEVERAASGECSLRLHGPVQAKAAADGVYSVSLSMSHEDDCAIAIVIARSQTGSRTARVATDANG